MKNSVRTLGALVATAASLAIVAPAQAATLDGVKAAITNKAGVVYNYDVANNKWQIKGGSMATAPAVATTEAVTHYIATGKDKKLYHRTDTTGWTQMAGDTFYCASVSATISNDKSKVHVACRGGNNAIYYFNFGATEQKPNIAKNYTSLGGVLKGSPAIIDAPAAYAPGMAAGVTVIARGGDYATGGDVSNLYAKNIGGSWVKVANAWNWGTGMKCSQDPTATSNANTIMSGCQLEDGVMAFAWRTGTGATADKRGRFLTTGSYVGKPGMAIGANGPTMTITGTNGYIYTRALPLVDPAALLLPGSWTRTSGYNAIPGVGASA